jgi:excisionase family DNA binding protein
MTYADASVTDTAPALERMLTASEVAQLFRVSAKTVGRWGRSGSLPLYRTVGGHHRYRLADVRSFLGLDTDAAATASV